MYIVWEVGTSAKSSLIAKDRSKSPDAPVTRNKLRIYNYKWIIRHRAAM